MGELLGAPLLHLLAGSNQAAYRSGLTWFRVAVLGLPGILVVLAGNGWMRGVQDTRRPVRIVVAANAVSAVASPLLVYPMGLGLVGSAVANLVAQAGRGALFVVALHAERRGWRPTWARVRAQLLVGRDLLLREVGFQAAFLCAAGDVAFMRSLTLASAVGVFVPVSLAALHWHWGIVGVRAGLTGFILARLVGMAARTVGPSWVVTGSSRPHRRS